MNRELIMVIEQLGREKGIDREILFEALETALLSASRKSVGPADNVRIQDLLAITGFSESKLERTFQKVFQLAPLQLLTRIRIQAAMHRLHGPGSIAQIAQAVGFGDQSAFTRRFVALVGMTPSAYRALRRD